MSSAAPAPVPQKHARFAADVKVPTSIEEASHEASEDEKGAGVDTDRSAGGAIGRAKSHGHMPRNRKSSLLPTEEEMLGRARKPQPAPVPLPVTSTPE